MSDKDREELKQMTQRGPRTTNAERERDLSEDILDRLEEIEAGESKTIAIRDKSLSALFGALDERDTDEMGAVLEALAEAAEKDANSNTMSELLRLSARVGLQTAAPDVWDELLEARRQRAEKNA